MPLIPILYIILGLSIGVGVTLIFLQERFVRERQKIIALGKAEKVKSAELLKKLDAKWENEVFECKEQLTAKEKDLEGSFQKISELEGAIREFEDLIKLAKLREEELEADLLAANDKEIEEPIASESKEESAVNSEALEEEIGKNKALDLLLATKEKECETLQQEKEELADNLVDARGEIQELHDSIGILKGKITALKEEQSNNEIPDDGLVMPPGSHYLPASVAKALMRNKS